MEPNRPPTAPSPPIVPGLDRRAGNVLASEGAAPPPVDADPAAPHAAEIGNRASLPPWAWVAALAVVVAVLLYLFTR
jgi:hypothetical protein